MYSPVESAIAQMWLRYSEPLSLADIAKSAILSRFHFCRVFRDATGVTPGRFLSAIRIYQAKRLLAATSLSVTEISLAVGYNSLGSFTNRFTDSVGASPTRFRRMWNQGAAEASDPAPRSSWPNGIVAGSVVLPAGYGAARVFVGAFQTPIVQRRPPCSIVIDVRCGSRASYQLANVPPGEWFIRAVAQADTSDPEPWTCRCLLVGGQGLVTVAAGEVSTSDLTLRARRPTDLPILFAIPYLGGQDISHPDDPARAGDDMPAMSPAISAPSGRQVA